MALKTAAETIAIAKKYVGCKQGDKLHKDLVRTFNTVKPHGNVATYTCAWCAITWTALMIKSGHTMANAPMGYNCGTLISDAKRLGLWEERDNVKPKVGWGVIYSWSDNGVGDCMVGASHIGIVSEVKGNTIYVIEGNMSTTRSCGVRKLAVNGRYIRGFIKQVYKTAPKKKTYKETYPKRDYPVLKKHKDGEYLGLGDKGSNVVRLHRVLDWYMGTHLDSGVLRRSYTKETERVVKQFQKRFKIAQTGKFGTISLSKAKSLKK